VRASWRDELSDREVRNRLPPAQKEPQFAQALMLAPTSASTRSRVTDRRGRAAGAVDFR
jgi:hypothetical protein